MILEYFNQTRQLENIDCKGLTSNEIKYLKILYEHYASARLNVLASRFLSKYIEAIIYVLHKTNLSGTQRV